MLKENTYICEHCKGEFLYTWSDEEALQEFDGAFPAHSRGEELVRVCDDCYKLLMTRYAATSQ